VSSVPRSSTSRNDPAASAFCVALATAERRVFSTGVVAAFFENFRME
jgi:hypothetical protein